MFADPFYRTDPVDTLPIEHVAYVVSHSADRLLTGRFWRTTHSAEGHSADRHSAEWVYTDSMRYY